MAEIVIGQTIAGYRLVALVGTGGMGRVYRATQTAVERVVALKIIRPDLASDPAFRDSFEQEARLAASIDHPHIIPVYEAEEVDGVLFVAMRWVDGADLREQITTKGPLEPDRAVEMLNKLAGGLDAAHAKGLIHRDIKPANVLLDGEHVFLSDFGLARTTGGTDQTTQIGGLIGTVDYLAPELVNGGDASVASDVYALGCVLFEMLTGSVPYPVDGLIAKLHAHTKTDPPVATARRPELPRGFDQVLGQALAKDPGRRFATAGALGDAAERALGTAPPRRARARAVQRPGVLAASGAVVAAFVAALVLALTGALGNSAHAQSNGRTLPAPASLRVCRALLSSPTGDCRNPDGGVDILTAQGSTARMRTMDFAVTKVIQSRAITDPVSGDTINAAPGDRFVILAVSIVNPLSTTQTFEPDEFGGRQTALWLYSNAGKQLSDKGPDSADYSEQNLPAVDTVPLSLLGKHFHREPSDPPFRGVLVFAYPTTELDRDPTAILTVHEFGHGLGDQRSVGVFRLRLNQHQIIKRYKAAVI